MEISLSRLRVELDLSTGHGGIFAIAFDAISGETPALGGERYRPEPTSVRSERREHMLPDALIHQSGSPG
jgi:hypothetical protein